MFLTTGENFFFQQIIFFVFNNVKILLSRAVIFLFLTTFVFLLPTKKDELLSVLLDYPMRLLNGDSKMIFLDKPSCNARIDVLLLCEDDGIPYAFLLIGAVATRAADINVSVCKDDGLHFLEGVLSHLCHSKPFCSGFYLLGIYYYHEK